MAEIREEAVRVVAESCALTSDEKDEQELNALSWADLSDDQRAFFVKAVRNVKFIDYF